MDEKIIQFLQTQIARSKDRLKPNVFESGNFYYPKRFAYFKIEKYINEFITKKSREYFIAMPGLSGMGKTTILAQLYWKFKNSFQDNRIVYVSLEDAAIINASFADVVAAYEKILGESLEKLSAPTLLLIDEIHQDPNWTLTLKNIYDRTKSLMVVFSGSSAVSIQIQKYDLARRTLFEKLYPLSFCEYLMIKNNQFPNLGLKEAIKEAIYLSSSAQEAYNKLVILAPRILAQWAKIDRMEVDIYLTTGTLPYTLKNKTADRAQILQGVTQMMDKIINKDIQQLGKFEPETIDKIKKILYILADSNTTSINKISGDLGMSAITVDEVLDVLSRAELVIKVPAMGSGSQMARKAAKFHFMSPAIRVALSTITGSTDTILTRRGNLLEDIAGLHFYREFVSNGKGYLSYDSAKGGADFIVDILEHSRIAFEIGTGIKDAQQVKATMAKKKCKFGVIISDSELVLANENIIKIPLDYFLMI